MEFGRFLRNINQDYEKLISKRFALENVKLNVDLSKVRGEDFYNILALVSVDFDEDCERAFKEIVVGARKKHEKKKALKGEKIKETNKYQNFINQFIVLQSDIADKASIENTRFTKVLTLQNNDFYAYEVYSIALSQEISAKSAFEQLYKSGGGDTTRNG